MDAAQRDNLYEKIVKHDEAGEFEDVIAACIEITKLRLPDLEKSVAWVNAGNTYGRMQNAERALECYEKAIQLEKPHNRFFAIEAKAAYLANHGEIAQALTLYEQLSRRGDLFLSDVQRIENNIESLRNKN